MTMAMSTSVSAGLQGMSSQTQGVGKPDAAAMTPQAQGAHVHDERAAPVGAPAGAGSVRDFSVSHSKDDPIEKGNPAEVEPAIRPGTKNARLAFTVTSGAAMPHVGCGAYVTANVPALALPSPNVSQATFTFSATLSMHSSANGRPLSSHATSLWRVMPRASKSSSHVPNMISPTAALPFPVSSAYTGLLSVNANPKIIITEQTFDFQAIVERLAKALSKFAMWGHVTLKDLSADDEVNVAIANSKYPSAVTLGQVYIPASFWMSYNDIATVMAYATTAAGSTVITDQMGTDTSGRPPMLAMVDARLAAACYKAIYCLGQFYDYCGLGTAWAYAYTRGIHASATVIAHTDEGGYVRSVLRRGAFEAPHGAIFPFVPTNWAGLPKPQGCTIATINAVIFSSLLSTAAGVALADPTVAIGGDHYPEVFTVEQNEPLYCFLPKQDSVADEDVQVVMADLIAANCSRFCDNYMYVLTKLFGFGPVDYTSAFHMTASFTWYRPTLPDGADSDFERLYPGKAKFVDRHLLRTGHYWYWIEPTGIISIPFDEMPACDIMSGPRALPGAPRQYPALPHHSAMHEAIGATGLVVKFRSARRTPAFDLLRENKRDGLAYIRIGRADPNTIALTAVNDNDPNALRDKIQQRPSVAELCWQRGDARVNAPAEFLSLADEMTIIAVHNLTVMTPGRATITHLPAYHELADWTVTYSTTKVQFIGHYKNGTPPKSVRQQRGTAVTAFYRAMETYGHEPVQAIDWIGSIQQDTYLVTAAMNADTSDTILDVIDVTPPSAGSVAISHAGPMMADLIPTETIGIHGSVTPLVGMKADDLLNKGSDFNCNKLPRDQRVPTARPHDVSFDAPPEAIFQKRLANSKAFGYYSFDVDSVPYTVVAAPRYDAGGAFESAMILGPMDGTMAALGWSNAKGDLQKGTLATTVTPDAAGVDTTTHVIKTATGDEHVVDEYIGIRTMRKDELKRFVQTLQVDDMPDFYIQRHASALLRPIVEGNAVGAAGGEMKPLAERFGASLW